MRTHCRKDVGSEKISEVVYSGRLFDVRRVVFEGDVVREVVVHPGAVAVVPFLEDGRLVLVEQFRHSVGSWMVEVPAGTIEKESPEECAARELEEETGYVAGEMHKIGEFFLAPGYSTELLQVFLAKKLGPGSVKRDVDEDMKILTVPFSEALAMIRSGRIRDAKTIASLLLVKFLEIF